MLVVDSSVAVPALVTVHEQHRMCLGVLTEHAPAIAGHAWIETFAVVTRLPVGASGAEDATRMLAQHVPDVRWPDIGALSGFLATCARVGVTGGATYDALVALAVPPGCRLVSRDRRARHTYRLMGVDAVSPRELA